MVFEVKESNDVMRFNIGRTENKMAANMAEIWYSKWLYLEFYDSWRPNVGVVFMVFEVKESNDGMRFNIGRTENKMAADMAEIWYSKWLYIEFYDSLRPNVGVVFMVFEVK